MIVYIIKKKSKEILKKLSHEMVCKNKIKNSIIFKSHTNVSVFTKS